MPLIEVALTAAVLAEASITDLIGQRFHAVGEQQATYPYVTWQGISRPGAPHLDGPSNLDWPRFQIDSWGTSALEALTVAEALRSFLDRVERSGAGLSFYGEFEDQRGPAFDIDTRHWGVSQDYFLWHARS